MTQQCLGTEVPTIRTALLDELTPAAAAVQVERAKGVLMSRYDLDAATAAGLLFTWSAQQRITPETVAEVLVNDIWQGRKTMTEPELVRWLERCLRSLP